MSVKFLRRSERKYEDYWQHEFCWPGEKSWGFSFPCDETGNIGTLAPAGQANLAKCLSGMVDGQPIEDHGVQKFTRTWFECSVIECPRCGHEVHLENGLDNDCPECGACYNMSGQSVVPSWRCDSQGEPIRDEEGRLYD